MADYWDEYSWIVVLGVLVAFFMSYGIGANDVANAFATSVGSKTLTLMQATLCAAVFEFLGAMLLGRGVTSTIKSGIVDVDEFENSPEVLMYGMFCALLAAGIWLLIATALELPVSTTHSIFGGLIGMALVAYGGPAVTWHEENDKDDRFPIKGVSAVVLSWVISPVCSGIVAVIFFGFARTFILRHENSYERAFYFMPALVLICVFINAFYVLDKGIDKQWKYLKDNIGRSAWIAAVIAAGSFIIAIFVAMWLKKRMDAAHSKGDVEGGNMEKTDSGSDNSFWGQLTSAVNRNDPHAAIDEDEDVRTMHEHAEVFSERTEGVFRYLQVLTACADSFAHGGNDVANAVGPLAAIWAIYRTQEVSSKSDVEEWILFIGALGIVIGLGTYGYTIIKAIGVKLTKITPSRGFAIELGSALVITTGSYYGLPLSTTHCQVGATVAVGLLEGGRGISWKMFSKTMVGWVITLVVVGVLSAIFMALGIYSPNVNASDALNTIKTSVGETGESTYTRALDACPAQQAALDDARGFFQGVTENNPRYPLRVADAIDYMADLNEGVNTCTFPSLPELFPYTTDETYDYKEPEEDDRKK